MNLRWTDFIESFKITLTPVDEVIINALFLRKALASCVCRLTFKYPVVSGMNGLSLHSYQHDNYHSCHVCQSLFSKTVVWSTVPLAHVSVDMFLMNLISPHLDLQLPETRKKFNPCCLLSPPPPPLFPPPPSLWRPGSLVSPDTWLLIQHLNLIVGSRSRVISRVHVVNKYFKFVPMTTPAVSTSLW